MVTTLSIDVGIRNLACCLMEISDDGTSWNILDWFVLDLFEYSPPNEDNPKEDLVSVFKTYKQWKKDGLIGFVTRNDLTISSEKRESYEAAVKTFLQKQKITNAYVNNATLDYVTKKIIAYFDKHSGCMSIDHLLIENQPSLKNPTMKSIQMIIYSYFFLRFSDAKKSLNIQFVSATRKMAYCKAKKLIDQKTEVTKNYKTTKQCSVIVSKIILEHRPEYEVYFTRAKKDDLADCLLQGMAYHNVANPIAVN